MALEGVKSSTAATTTQTGEPVRFSFQKETPAQQLQKLLAEQKKKYDAMTPEEKAKYDKAGEEALAQSIKESREATEKKGFIGRIVDGFKKDYKDVDSVGDFLKATVARANRTGATAILGAGLALIGGGAALKAMKGAKALSGLATGAKTIGKVSSATKALGTAAILPAAAALTSCEKDSFLDDNYDIYTEDKLPVQPREIINTVEVPVIKRDTLWQERVDTLEVPVYITETDTLWQTKIDTVYVPEVVHDTIYQEIQLPPEIITEIPDYHSEVNPYIDDMMDELGVKQEGDGEFTESFVTYDEHNSRVIQLVLDPQASARDGSSLRYNKIVTNWDDEAGTITPGKNEERGTVDVSISHTGDGLNLLEKGQGVQTMDLNREGNLYMVQNKSGESTSSYEPTPLLQAGGWLSRGDFDNSIKWNWQTGAFGHFTNATRKKSNAPVKGDQQ